VYSIFYKHANGGGGDEMEDMANRLMIRIEEAKRRWIDE
jgi:hypothetical protein